MVVDGNMKTIYRLFYDSLLKQIARDKSWVVSWLWRDGFLVDFNWEVQWNSQVELDTRWLKSVKITGPKASLKADEQA